MKTSSTTYLSVVAVILVTTICKAHSTSITFFKSVNTKKTLQCFPSQASIVTKDSPFHVLYKYSQTTFHKEANIQIM